MFPIKFRTNTMQPDKTELERAKILIESFVKRIDWKGRKTMDSMRHLKNYLKRSLFQSFLV